jgi:NhaP-type Na+/H+ or K+/H+ antiporter/rhodanese-related sulfurtransferase
MPLLAAADFSAFAAGLALLGVVLLLAGLLSGWIERSGAPQVAVFLALGLAIGPFGLKQFEIGLDSDALRVVCTLTLALILFTEALSLDLKEVRQHLRLALLILGPGTIAAAFLIGAAIYGLLRIEWPLALMVGAALASTDPVLLRALLKWRGLPRDTRLALRLESGLNDVVLLPIIMVCIAIVMQTGEPVNVPGTLLRIIILSPIAGIVVGFAAVAILAFVRRSVGVKREYESLYSLGVCFVSFGVAEAFHASGFVAAFAAGATIASLDMEMCDCFHEYGETTSELAVLGTFVLLGVSVAWSGLQIPSWEYLVVMLIAFCARPLALLVSLNATPMKPKSRFTLMWFGPRGLSSLHMCLIPVFAGVPGSEALFTICCSVMFVSIVLHGGSVMYLEKRARKPGDLRVIVQAPQDGPTLTVSQVLQRQDQGESVLILDARSHKAFVESNQTLPGAMRIDPDRAAELLLSKETPEDTLIIAFCTCPYDRTAKKVAGELRRNGFRNAFALAGGWDAWIEASQPVVPKA